MTLSEWLAAEGLTQTDAAARLGLPVSTFHDYLYGRRSPRLRKALAISKATKGKVTVADLLPEIARAFAEKPVRRAVAPSRQSAAR